MSQDSGINNEENHHPLYSWWAVIVIVCAVIFTARFTYLSYERWVYYLPGLLDHPNIESAVWNTAHGKLMFSDVLNGMFWTDHFSPVLLLASIYYLFGDSYIFMFLWMNVSIAATAIPIFLIARKFLKSDSAAMFIALCFLANGNIQMAGIPDYHMVSHEGFFTLSAFYALLTKRWRWYVVFLCLTLSVKEDSFIHLSWLGFYAIVAMREYRWGLITWALGLGYAALVFLVVYPFLQYGLMPEWLSGVNETHFKDDHYLLSPMQGYLYAGYYDWLGPGGMETVRNVLENYDALLGKLWSRPHLVKSWGELAAKLAYLPFLTPTGFLMVTGPSAEIMLAEPLRIHGLYFHYCLKVVPVWTLAAIMGLSNIQRITGWVKGFVPDSDAVSKTRIALKFIALAIAIIYGVLLAYYYLIGPIDFNILGAHISLRNAPKSVIYLGAAAFAYILLARGPHVTGIFGKTAESKLAVIAGIYMFSASIFYAHFYGGLPVSKPFRDIFKYDNNAAKHARHVAGALKIIPPEASLAVTPAIYNHYTHNPNARVFSGIDAYYSVEKHNPEYVAIEFKSFNQMQNTHYRPWIYKELTKLFSSDEYGLHTYKDGLFIFKLGAAAKPGWHLAGVTYDALDAPHAIGEEVKDTGASSGHAHKASKKELGKGGHLVYGPYAKIGPGSYKAVFRLKTSNPSEATSILIDVNSFWEKVILAKRELTGGDFTANEWQEFGLDFTIPDGAIHTVEMRVEYKDGEDISFDFTRLEMTMDVYAKNLQYPAFSNNLAP